MCVFGTKTVIHARSQRVSSSLCAAEVTPRSRTTVRLVRFFLSRSVVPLIWNVNRHCVVCMCVCAGFRAIPPGLHAKVNTTPKHVSGFTGARIGMGYFVGGGNGFCKHTTTHTYAMHVWRCPANACVFVCISVCTICMFACACNQEQPHLHLTETFTRACVHMLAF